MFIIRIIFSICGWTKSSFHPDSVGTFAIIVLTNVAVFTNPPRPRPAPGLIIRLTGAGAGAVQGAGAPNSEEHQIGILTIKTPSANRRCLESNNGSKKSYDDLSPYLGPGQRAQPPHQYAGTEPGSSIQCIRSGAWCYLCYNTMFFVSSWQ